MKSHWSKPDGSMEAHDSPNEPSLKDMQEFVGGDIELVNVLFLASACHMIVHGEGALIGLPVNEWATDIYHNALRHRNMSTVGAPPIHGPAIVFEGRLT